MKLYHKMVLMFAIFLIFGDAGQTILAVAFLTSSLVSRSRPSSLVLRLPPRSGFVLHPLLKRMNRPLACSLGFTYLDFGEKTVSILTAMGLKQYLEEELYKPVDIISVPMPDGAIIEIGRTVRIL